jgi:hypothetical protein
MPRARITVSLLAEDQEFQRLQAADALDAAARADLEVQVLFAENQPVVQIQQLFKAIHACPEQRPTAVVV